MSMSAATHSRLAYFGIVAGMLLLAAGLAGLMLDSVALGITGIATGAVSALASLRILMRREAPAQEASIDPMLDQTCELNYRPEHPLR